MAKKQVTKRQTIARYAFAFILIIVGTILSYLNVGDEFLGFASVGAWLLYVGFVMLAIVTITAITKKDRIVDERMEMIGHQASRVTFLFIILGAFIVMVWDGINPIKVPYSMFMSYMIMSMVLVYLIAYKIIEKRY